MNYGTVAIRDIVPPVDVFLGQTNRAPSRNDSVKTGVASCVEARRKSCRVLLACLKAIESMPMCNTSLSGYWALSFRVAKNKRARLSSARDYSFRREGRSPLERTRRTGNKENIRRVYPTCTRRCTYMYTYTSTLRNVIDMFPTYN